MYPSYFIDQGTYKEIIRDDKLLFCCPFCGEWFKGLAYHTNQKHGVTGKELRKMFNLRSNYQLTTPEIKARHREIVLLNAESHIKNNLLNAGEKTRFKEGCEGHIKQNWSAEALAKYKQTRRELKNKEA